MEKPGPVIAQEPAQKSVQQETGSVTSPVVLRTEGPVKEETPKKPEEETQASDASEVKFPEVELLESPLPLPKKHVKKAVDFAIDIPEDDDYDYPVAEDDDYDV